jgi:simple sugar transport system ATP-binding protein
MGSLKAVGLRKTFPGVVALDNVNMEVQGGTIHALVGANGAGKSTLIKILTGYYPEYEGTISIDEQPVSITLPSDAISLGIEVVHQEVDAVLIPYLSVAENLLIERLAVKGKQPFLNWPALYKEAEVIAQKVGFKVNVRKRVEDLAMHEKQLLVIARAVSHKARYLILDEPTASLSVPEVEQLFAVIKELNQQGVGIIYISHRLGEVSAIADEISVLRNGKKVAHFKEEEMDMSRIVEAMLNLTVYKGEVLGITGLVGAGKTELLRLIFGADTPDGGQILIQGQEKRINSPGQAVKEGIFMIPEERRTQGILVENSIRENITLPFLNLFSLLSIVIKKRETKHTLKIIDKIGLTPPKPEMLVKNLSGGNQQKVVIGKWFGREPLVMIFDEATIGIDVRAKQDVYQLSHDLGQNAGVIYASSDIDEILGVSDRVMVMRDGEIVAEMSGENATRHEVLEYATGAHAAQGNDHVRQPDSTTIP